MGQNFFNRVVRVAPGTVYTSGNLLGSNITPTQHRIYTVSVSISVSTTFSLVINSVNLPFNSGNALAANAIYTFSFVANAEDAVNFQFGAGCTVQYFIVGESLE